MTNQIHELQDQIAGLKTQLKATQAERDAALHMNQELIKEKTLIAHNLSDANKALHQMALDLTRAQAMIEEIRP